MHTTRTRTTVRRSLVLALVAIFVGLGLTACDPNTPADCSKDCIQMVYANYNGDKVTLVGTGAVSSETTLYTDAARTKVAGYTKNYNLTMYPTMAITTKYYALPVEHPVTTQLTPATTYWYSSRVTGAKGKSYSEKGSFKTKQRIVTLTIDKIWVYDDSDHTGAGELTFDARINGGSAYRVIQDLNWPSDKSHESIGVTKTLTGVMNTVTLQVRGSDDDCTFSTCTVPANRWDAVGSNGDTQWSTATFTLTAPPEGRDGTFTTKATGGGLGDIGFHLWGHWTVRYENA